MCFERIKNDLKEHTSTAQATFSFDLYEEQEALKTFSKAFDMSGSIHDFYYKLRSIVKHGQCSEEELPIYEKIFDEFCEEFGEYL